MDMSCSYHLQGKLNDLETLKTVLFTSLEKEQGQLRFVSLRKLNFFSKWILSLHRK